MIAILLMTLFVVAATAMYWWATARKQSMEAAAATPPVEGIPLAPDAHWLFGHMIEMSKGGFQAGQRKVIVDSADADGLSSFWFLHQAAVTVLAAKDVKAVLNASSYREALAFLKKHNDVFLGQYALTALTGKDWKYYRNVVHRSFTPAALQESQEAINTVARTLTQSLLEAVQAQSTTKRYQATVLPLMKMATMDVFCLAALGVDVQCCRTLRSSPIAQAFDYLTDEYTRRLSKPWDPTAWFYGIPTAANRRHARERKLLRTFIAELVATKRNQIMEKNDTRSSSSTKDNSSKDLLTSLLNANAEKGGDMSDIVLADTLMVLLFGGYDTTSITLAYALHLLATHETVQEECLREIQSVLGTSKVKAGSADDTTTLDDPADLPYTRAVILETLRLYPAAPVTTRNLEKPLELHGKVIPKGTMMYVSIWSIQRDARNYPKPEEFRPDRWVEKTTQDGTTAWVERDATITSDDDNDDDHDIPVANRDAFCAFSGGARNCVGKVLAMQEAVTLLAFLLRDLKFECLPGYQLEPTLSSFIQKPGDDLPMIISARH